ncbi:pyridoxal phosphate-dependent aminotransferase [Umboniibacter marinipuniceus]|uniref:Aminotransferase n=1 Tax=Umboniibacter marinipuniceus TaxID=569599 RepID=A0A3M0A505_9GAMM|nr:pyridoxal phosphate-dependent aminotransferase [Umboniibacter marinipuniceus]RMA80251.1 L-aspartate aminotransferase [Umboniibacter marinipuniceus]
MKFSSLTQRIASEGAAAWDIHYRAMARQQAGEDIVVLSVGDPDVDTPALIKSAAIQSIQENESHYTDCQGELELRTMISQWESKRRQRTVLTEQIVVQAGAQCGLFSVAQCLFEPGDNVIIPEPMYITYEAVFRAAQAEIRGSALQAERNWAIDLEDIESKIDERTRAIVINTPNNPTGAMLSSRDWQKLAQLAVTHKIWLIVDEVYSELVYEGEHVLPLELDGIDQHLITINSLSKSHAMTGWRLGWVTGPIQLAEHLSNLALCMLYGMPMFIQRAAEVAFSEHASITQVMRETYRARRDVAVATLRAAGIPLPFIPPAGMFLMLDIRPTGLSAQGFAEQLLDQEGVSVLVGDAFGTSASGFVRLSFCVSRADMERAIQRLSRFYLRQTET